MLEQRTGVYDNPYKFNAKELDRETGLYYYGARYYNPRASIWYGVDPLAIYNPARETQFYGDGEHNGGVFYWGNLNPYIYTYQNPIKYIDPNGKQGMAGALIGVPNKEKDNVISGWTESLRQGGGYQADFVPVYGDAKGIAEGIWGTDFQGNKLSGFERLISVAMLSELRDVSRGSRALNETSKLRKITKPLWGAGIRYGNDVSTAIKHIADGHFFNSRVGRATSRFSQKFSNIESVKKLVSEAVTNGEHITSNRGDYSVIHKFDETIGTSSDGKSTKILQVFMDSNGNVLNAYPVSKNQLGKYK